MPTLVHKGFEAAPEMVSATESALSLVRKHAQRPVTEEDVFLAKMCLSSTAPDNDGECFTKPQLERFQETIIGKSLLEGHDYKKKPLGRFYDAEIVPHGTDWRLMASCYVNRKNEQLVSDIELGIQKHTSIGAYVADEFICNLCNLDYSGAKSEDGRQCSHQVNKKYDGQRCTITRAGDLDDYRSVEGSLVFLGAHPDAAMTTMSAAHIAKAALLDQLQQAPAPKGDEMELKEALLKIEELEKSRAADPQLLADGQKYRDHLKAEITRMAGAIKKAEMFAMTLKHMESADASSLLPVYETVLQEFGEKFQVGTVGKMAEPKDEEAPKPKKFDPSRPAAIPAARS